MRFGGMVLATVLALSACTSDPATRAPSPGASSASASPTRAVPTMPPQASEDSAEGAAAFVHHYVDVFNYAAATGDVDELTRLSSPDCDGCQRYIEEFKKIYDAGNRIGVQLWTLSKDQLQIGRNLHVVAEVRVNEGKTKQYTFNFRLKRTARFVMDNITIEEGQ